MRSEVLLFSSGSASQSLDVSTPRTQHGNSIQFSVQSVGGNFFLPAQPASSAEGQKGLLWQIDNGSSGSVRMQSFSLPMSEHCPLPTLNLAFDVQLFPNLVLIEPTSPAGTHTSSLVAGLLSTGVIFHWEQPSEATRFSPEVKFYDLSSQILSHGSPTALGSSGGAILVGCSDGTVLGLSHTAFLSSSTASAPAFELRPSSWGLGRLIAGVFSRGGTQMPPVAACLDLRLSGKPPAALVVYDDCTVRAFALDARGGSHTEVLNDSLSAVSVQEAAAGRMSVASAVLCVKGAEVVLVATLESHQDTSQRATSIFSLATAAGASAPGSAGGKLVIQSRRKLAGFDAAATVVSATLTGAMDGASGGGGDVVWVLSRCHGVLRAAGYSTSSGQFVEAAMLHDQLATLAFEDSALNDVVARVSNPFAQLRPLRPLRKAHLYRR